MENASKALLIAGGMLLFILVASLAIYIWGRVGSETSEFYNKLEQSEIEEFNQKFYRFQAVYDETGKYLNPLKIHDVVSIINLAKDANESGRMNITVKVTIDGTEVQNEDTKELLKNVYRSERQYSLDGINGIHYNDLGIIDKVELVSIP